MILPTILLAVGSPAAPLDATEVHVVDLKHKTYRNWSVLLPDERFDVVSGGIPFPHIEGGSFSAVADGTSLWVDRDGDGEVDVQIEAPEEPGQTALLVLRVPREDQAPLSHAVRLQNDGTWKFATSGAMVGEFRGTKLQLIDQDNNGRYDDFGEDAMIVGHRSVAHLLSRVVSIDGELFDVSVSADGARVELAAHTGETGSIDFASALETEAKMHAVVIRSADGETSFEVAAVDGALNVPVGAYTIHSGQVGLGQGHADLSTGRFEPVAVTAGEETRVSWGGPVDVEFDYHRQGDQIVIAPNDLYYYGRAGEEYWNFMPLGESPEFTIKDRETGEVLVHTKFPGNC